MKRMKVIHKRHETILFLICVLTYIFFINGCAVNTKLQDEYTRPGLSSGIQTVFDKYRQGIPKTMAKHKIPGLSIAVVDRDGILWSAGFGYTDKDKKTPVTPDTIFAIGSITKTVTATAVMLAVQDGLVELDAPITKYIPDFTVNSRFEDNPQDKITLRHLLNHTSGIAQEAPVGNFRELSPSFEKHIKSISDTWLKYKVGAKSSYSNSGYDLAAYILQVRSGKPFAQYMKEKIFDPLDMSNSSIDMEFIKRHPNRAIGHMTHVRELPLILEISVLGAGGIYSSANDFAKFLQFHLNWGRVNGRPLLDESFISDMYTPSKVHERYGLEVFISRSKSVNLVHENYGLGIAISRDKSGNFIMYHPGGGFGFEAIFRWYPDYGIGAVLLTNSENKPLITILSRLIEEKLIEKSVSFDSPPWVGTGADESKPIPWQKPDSNTFTRYKPDWKKYTGTYRYIVSSWKLHTYASIALALGYSVPELQVKVYEKSGFLEIDGERLDEHLPGLFFTNEGECLDFRAPVPTWRNYRMKKIR